MPSTVQDLAALAIALAPEDRAQLADLLLASLPEEADSEVETAWEQEVGRRVASVQAGTAHLVPADEVHERARKIFSR